jgi:hypothetical protein
MNAAECISAAERCEPAYRDLTFAIAEAWLSLVRQQEALGDLEQGQLPHVDRITPAVLYPPRPSLTRARRFRPRAGMSRLNAPEMVRRLAVPSKK